MVNFHHHQVHQHHPHNGYSARRIATGRIANWLQWWPALGKGPEILLPHITAPESKSIVIALESKSIVIGTVKDLSRIFFVL